LCGLVGFSGPEPFDLVKINTLMYISSIERGIDASGIYSPLNGLKKDTTPGWKYVTEGLLDLKPDRMLIAHVRAKTIGINISKNAHPFMRGKCVLAHNGTLKNHWPILHKYELPIKDYDVDSDVLCGAINAVGTLKPLKEIDGAAAVLINGTDLPYRMYVFRNKERPLFRGNIGPNVYICSISEALNVIGCINIKEFKEDHTYCLENGELVNDPKKIKNTPVLYKKKEDTNSNCSIANTVTLAAQLRKAIGCNIRAKNDVRLHTSGTLKLALIKNKYYKVTGVVDNNTYKIFDPVTNIEHNVNSLLFREEDIILADDYVKAITNTEYIYNDDPKYKVKKGDINKVSSSYYDGDLSLAILKDEPRRALIFKKECFIKLTGEELITFLATDNTVNDKEDKEILENCVASSVLSNAINYVPSKNIAPMAPPFKMLEENFNNEAKVDAETNYGAEIVAEEEQSSMDLPLPNLKLEGENLVDKLYTSIGDMSEKLERFLVLARDEYFLDVFLTNKIEEMIEVNKKLYNNIFDDDNKT